MFTKKKSDNFIFADKVNEIKKEERNKNIITGVAIGVAGTKAYDYLKKRASNKKKGLKLGGKGLKL